MALQISISDATSLGFGVWSVPLAPADIRRLGDVRSSLGRRSVLATTGAQFDDATGQLSIALEATVVWNIGTGNEALVVEMGQADGDPQSQNEVDERGSTLGTGDAAFLAACRRLMSPELAEVAEQLLIDVRARLGGELQEGLARKWVNYPRNCLAITIQPRDASYAIQIKGQPEAFNAPSLEIKPDRPSYCRFKLSSAEQLADAGRVVAMSAGRRIRGIPGRR